MNILITDYSRPFYNDYILPYGRLREGRSAYKRADIIIVSKCPLQLTQQEADAIKLQVNPLAHQHLFFSTIRYEKPYDFFTNEVVALEEKHVVLVCCIARPEPLVSHLEGISKGVHVLSYPDHHYFVSRDMEEIKAAYGNWDVADKVIVTTEKDAARLHLHKDKLQEWGIQIIVLPIAVEILLGKGYEFDQLVTRYTEKALAEHNGLSDLDNLDVSFDEVV